MRFFSAYFFYFAKKYVSLQFKNIGNLLTLNT